MVQLALFEPVLNVMQSVLRHRLHYDLFEQFNRPRAEYYLNVTSTLKKQDYLERNASVACCAAK